MLQFTVRRLLLLIPTVIITSLVAFVVIQLPPGDFMTAVAARYASQGETIDETALAAMRANYGLDQPIYVQYLKWTANIITKGDFGYSFLWSTPVSRVVWDRLGLTMLLS